MMSSPDSLPNDPDLFHLPPTGAFRNAPFTKFWFATLIACSGLQISQHIYGNKPLPSTSLADASVIDLLCSPFIARSSLELTFSAIIVYFLRNVERRFGTRKYINTLVISLLLSHGVHLCLLTLITRGKDPSQIYFPYSPLTLIYVAYINYVIEIPVFATTMLFEVLPACDHHFILISLLQTFSQGTLFHFALPGIIATIIYRCNLLYIQKVPVVPQLVARVFSDRNTFIGSWIKTFEEIVELKKGRNLPIAATLERQKIEEDDEIHRQLFQRQARNFQRRPAGPPPETLIRSLMDMGFNDRNEVINVLQEVGHNVEMAANLLLQRRFNG
ncbi:hypothetical protein FO519_001735 [Halicephalobus sp. NKZ332]|nr:hypothetical protein FO519_001735 [Halicephalobus sp. NKZ332]